MIVLKDKRILIPTAVVVLLLIGIAIPKLTVHDTISADTDRSCINWDIESQRENSLLKRLFFATGAFQVTRAERGGGDSQFYTLFRIPIGGQMHTICDYVLSPLSLPDLTLKSWYPHRESNVNILFLKQEIVPEIGMSEMGAYGEYIHVNSLPIEMTPEQWVADRQLETDLANKYEWDFVKGRRHLRVTHPTPAADAQTDYFFGYGHVVISMFYPVSTLKDDSLQRYDYDRFLYNSIAPLVDTAYSRDMLRQNCAQEVPRASIDDTHADTENGIVTLRWWDGAAQEDKVLEVAYEPETDFAGCSESVKSILKHIQEIDDRNRESGFYD